MALFRQWLCWWRHGGHDYIPVVDDTLLRYRVQYHFCGWCGKIIDPYDGYEDCI